MERTALQASFSAEVESYLAVDGRKLRLAKIGSDRIMLRNPVELDPCRAEIVITIDGRERRRQVFLPNGSVPFDLFVEIELLDESPGQ
jgi:hypothetical protein